MRYLYKIFVRILFFGIFALPWLYAIRTQTGNNAINTNTFATTYLGISSNSTHAPVNTDTTLAGLITTPSGMACQTATVTHTAGTNQSVASATFTNSTGSTITVYLVGLFSNSACTSGMLSEDYAIPATGTGIPIAAGATQVIGVTENY